MTNPRDNQVAKALRIADVIDPNRQSRDYGADVKQWREERAMKGHKKNYNPWSDTSNIYTYPTEERHDPKDPMYYISPEEYKKGLYDRDVYALARGGRAHMAVGGDPTIPTTEPTGALTDPTANYVRSLYQNVMGRQADDAGINYWAGQINQGNLSPADVLQQFAGSKEFQGVYQADPSKAVNALYQTALGRAPDQAGLDYWTQQAKGGMDLSQMVSGFTESEEGQPLSVNWSYYLQKAFPDQSREGEYQVAGGWQSQATPVPSSSQDLQNYLGELETKYNLPSGLLLPMMGIESQYGTNQKKAGNPHYGAFQLSNDLIKQFKVKNPYDWKENANAAAQYALENKNRYADKFGRDPTPAEYYNMHQQGFHGYTKLRAALDKNPNAPAAKVAPTRAAILNNMPSTLGKNRNPTASEWLNAWEQKFNQMSAGPDQQGVQAVASYYQQYPRIQTAGGTAGSGASSQDPALALAADKAAWQKNRDAYITDRISKGLPATLPPELTNYTPGAGGTITAPSTTQWQQPNVGTTLANQGAGGNVAGATGITPISPTITNPTPTPMPDASQPWMPPGVGTTSGSSTFQPFFGYPTPTPWYEQNPMGVGGAGSVGGGGGGGGDFGAGVFGAGAGLPGGTSVGSGGFGVGFNPAGMSKGGAVNDALRIARATGGGAWTRKEGKNPKGGLNEKGRASLRAQGHDIKRPQPEGGARKDSFCSRMHGLKEKLTSSETANDPNSRINKSLRVWNCHSAGGAVDNALNIAKYPERKKKDWVISHDYEDRGGKMKEMSPDEFLDRTRPLHMDDATKASVSSYKSHMKHGDKMDPLQLLANGMEDGRHRATAAKELGIDKVPVIDFRKKRNDGGSLSPLMEDKIREIGDVELGKYGIGPNAPLSTKDELSAGPEQSTWEKIASEAMGDRPSPERRHFVEGVGNIYDVGHVGSYFTPLSPYVGAVDFARGVSSGDPVEAALGAAGLPGKGAKAAGVAVSSMMPDEAQAIVPTSVAKMLKGVKSLPTSDIFRRAVEANPKAKIEDGFLVMSLVRGQKPEQSMQRSVREGVFYLPESDKNLKFYKGSWHYGGPEIISGETAFNNPLFVKGGTGGKAPEAAYTQLYGKDAMKKLDSDISGIVNQRYWMSKQDPNIFRDSVANFLAENGGNPNMANYIIRNSREGNQLRYAIQENIIGNAVRNAGHDAVIGYGIKRDPSKTPFFSEVFDVRESHYPSKYGEYKLHSKFEDND